MADDKKYYWLKLKRDFFKRHDIQIIEAMPNGKDYVLFYLKLLCESVDHEGNLRFSEEIPYNEEMLAALTSTNVDIVRSAVKLFAGLKMIDVMDDGTYYMNQVEKMIGSETYWAQKKREQRERQLEAEKIGQCPKLSNESPSCPSKSIDIEKDIEYRDYISDKNDKIDKSVPLHTPNALTRELINAEYISECDIYIDEYNAILQELIDEYSFEIVRSCLWYFIKRYKQQPTDEDGNEIENKVAYFRTAVLSGAERLDRENNKSFSGFGSFLYN